MCGLACKQDSKILVLQHWKGRWIYKMMWSFGAGVIVQSLSLNHACSCNAGSSATQLPSTWQYVGLLWHHFFAATAAALLQVVLGFRRYVCMCGLACKQDSKILVLQHWKGRWIYNDDVEFWGRRHCSELVIESCLQLQCWILSNTAPYLAVCWLALAPLLRCYCCCASAGRAWLQKVRLHVWACLQTRQQDISTAALER